MDLLGAVTTLIIGIIAAFALLHVHRKNREVAQEAVKVSCLNLMGELSEQRAYLKNRMKFIVEETFKLYYGKYIPIEVIQKICSHKNASYAFLAYKEVSGLMLFDNATKKFNILSEFARILRLIALLEIGLLMLVLSGAMITLIFTSINSAQVELSFFEFFIFFFLGGLAALCFWSFFFIINRGLNEYQNLRKMKLELNDDVEETLTRSIDAWLVGILTGVLSAIFLSILLINKWI